MFHVHSDQLKRDLCQLKQHSAQQEATYNHEHKQMRAELLEFESLISHLRDDNGQHWSQINTYRCLLNQLSSFGGRKSRYSPSSNRKINTFTEQITGFQVRMDSEKIWTRI